jgi:ligand-binding sensor domain-containing protein
LAHTGSQGINDIQDIAITPNGLVWAATPGGLKQYDGRQWHIFTTGDGLASDALRQVTAAPDNTLWLAYADPADGVTLFDATGAVPTAQTAALPVAALQVAAVLPDGLLFSIPGGLFYADTGGAGRLFRAPADLPTHELTGLVVADSGVWAAGSRSISRFDGAAWHTYTATQGLPDMATAALTLDPHGEPVMALASASQSIARYNPAQDRWEMIACPLDGPPAAAVRAGLQTADGTPNGAFWFATPEGLARTDGEEWQIFTSADGLPSDNVQTLATDGQRLWVGTDAGLSLYQDGLWQTVLVDDVRALSRGPDGALWYFSETGLFQLIDGRSPTAIPLPPVNQVYDQWAAADGFWIATDAGVFFWPTQGDGVGAWQTFPTADGQPMGEVTALAMAADGVMWAGTGQGVWQLAAGAWGLRPLPELAADGPITRLVAAADGSLFVGLYEGRVYRVVNGQTTAENPVLLGDEYAPVSAILLPGDALWLAHFGGGVSRGVGLPGERTWHRFETDDRQEMQVNSVAAALRTFWLGTDKGLLVITGQDGDWRCQLEWRGEPPDWAGVLVDHAGQVWGVNGQTFWRLSAGEKVRSGVLASPVTAVAPDGAVWVVTANGLVRHANGRRQLVETAAITGQITAVAPAAHGVLWVGTTDGLFGYDGRDWTHYTAADGLAANHVTHVAAAPDGSVWVGTVGGVSWLRP